MGNPSTETTAPPAGNDNATAALNLLALTGECLTMPQQQALIDAAGVRAQLAIVHELNTIGRILAFQNMQDGDVETFLGTDIKSGAKLSKSIVERLGL